MTCSRIRHFVCLVLSFAFLSAAAKAQDVTPLEAGKTISRTTKRQQVDTYSLTLTAGQFIHVTVEQDAQDAILEFYAPDNKLAHRMNATRFFGTESLSWEAAASGLHSLVIRTTFDGKYQLNLEVKNAANATDQQRIAAERLMTEMGQGGPTGLPLEQRQERYQQALKIWRELGDKQAEAQTHDAMGMTLHSERKYPQSRESFQQALAIKAENNDRLGQIGTLINLAIFTRISAATPGLAPNEIAQLRQQDRAHLEQALTISRELKQRSAERKALHELVANARSLGLRDRVLELLEQVLALDRESQNRSGEADILGEIGVAYRIQRDREKALDYFEKSLAIFRELKDRTGEARSLDQYALELSFLGREDEARRNYEAVLAIHRELKDRRGEALALRSIGFFHSRANRDENALRYYEEALAIFRELKDQFNVTNLLFILGAVTGRVGRNDDSQRYYDEHLATFRANKDRKGEADALFQIGYNNQLISRFDKALIYYALALPIHLELKNRTGEAEVYREYGNTYGMMGHYDKALENFERSLPIWRELKNRLHEGSLLNNIGFAYGKLNRPERAIEYLDQAVAIYRQINNPHFESGALDNLASAYRELGQYEKAISYAEQALAIVRKLNVRADEGFFLNTLGLIFHKQGNYEKAAEAFTKAILLLHQTKWRAEEGSAHSNLADALRVQGQLDKAIAADLQALQIAREVKAIDNESFALTGLMKDWQARNQPRLAILFGKQAVNASQEMRSNFSRLDRETQTSFLKSKEQTYRDLADLLISQGRLPEAEQVIRMLKEEEFFEYIRRDVNNSPKSERAALTPEEAAIDKRYREIADKLTEIGAQRAALLEKQVRTPEEEKLITQLEADLAVAGQVFEKFLDGLSNEFAKHRAGQNRLFQLREAQGFMSDLRELGKGTVAIYTLVGATKFRVILITPAVRKAYEYPIDEAAFNRKVLALRAVLRNSAEDARPAARELYQIVFAPLAKDLRAMRAETLMWSLDGVLRYVPIAALYDGEQYLVERYRNVVFTPASQSRLKDEPRTRWQALGLGVTRGLGDKLAPLPAVAEEMRSIIKDANDPSSQGVLPGTIKLNEQFTQESMLVGLRQRPPVVHVASHFEFKPGNEVDSALLLGDGKFLSLAQIKVMSNVFDGVELLTLSACDTATGGSGGTGKEVEGFAVQAQRQGAKAVVASLWPVADRTTRLLMEAFYRGREEQRLSKGEALRQAQIKLLRGELTRKSAAEVLANRGSDEPVKTGNERAEIKRPYAHPYYWAPFIMIGNWK